MSTDPTRQPRRTRRLPPTSPQRTPKRGGLIFLGRSPNATTANSQIPQDGYDTAASASSAVAKDLTPQGPKSDQDKRQSVDRVEDEDDDEGSPMLRQAPPWLSSNKQLPTPRSESRYSVPSDQTNCSSRSPNRQPSPSKATPQNLQPHYSRDYVATPSSASPSTAQPSNAAQESTTPNSHPPTQSRRKSSIIEGDLISHNNSSNSHVNSTLPQYSPERYRSNRLDSPYDRFKPDGQPSINAFPHLVDLSGHSSWRRSSNQHLTVPEGREPNTSSSAYDRDTAIHQQQHNHGIKDDLQEGTPRVARTSDDISDCASNTQLLLGGVPPEAWSMLSESIESVTSYAFEDLGWTLSGSRLIRLNSPQAVQRCLNLNGILLDGVLLSVSRASSSNTLTSKIHPARLAEQIRGGDLRSPVLSPRRSNGSQQKGCPKDLTCLEDMLEGQQAVESYLPTASVIKGEGLASRLWRFVLPF